LADMLAIAEQERKKEANPKKCYFYSKILEPKYHLTNRFVNQFTRYKRLEVFEDRITTTTELADYLKIARSTISRPIKEVMGEKDYKEMIALYKKLGGSRGGKNGDKTANFKGSGNS
jgi:DNA invertase Pin-like site-specific DNA recombinase